MPASRPDFAEYIAWLQLEGREKDPLAFLAETNGRRQTDTKGQSSSPWSDEFVMQGSPKSLLENTSSRLGF